MKKLLIGILALTILSSGCKTTSNLPSYDNPLPEDQIIVGFFNSAKVYKNSKAGIVYISTTRMSEEGLLSIFGSGFVIKVVDGKPQIITAAHIVSSNSSITVEFINGVRYTAKLITLDEGRDLALLEITDKQDLNSPEPEYKILALANLEKVKIGEQVILIGHPLGLKYSITSGVISALRKEIIGPGFVIYNAIQTDTDIIGGNSGGPLLLSNGKVIGIVNFGRGVAKGGYLGFCTSSYDIQRFIDNLPGQVNPNILYVE